MRLTLGLWLFVLIALWASPAKAQNPGQIQIVTVTPSGACSPGALRLLSPSGVLYTCQNGSWAAAGGGGGSANPGNIISVAYSSSITPTCTGTNPSTAGTLTTFVVGQLTGALTVNNPTNCTSGQSLGFYLLQGSTPYSQTWGSAYSSNAATLPTVANAYVYFEFKYDGTTWNQTVARAISGISPLTTGQIPSQASTGATVAATAHNIDSPLVCSGTTTCTTSPSFTPVTNDTIVYIAGATVTSLSLAVNGASAATVRQNGSSTISFTSGQAYLLTFDGTYWNNNGPSGGGSSTCNPTAGTGNWQPFGGANGNDSSIQGPTYTEVMEVILPCSMNINSIKFNVYTNVASSWVAFTIYSASGALLYTSSSISAASTGNQSGTIVGGVLPAGTYLLGWSGSSSSIFFNRASFTDGNTNLFATSKFGNCGAVSSWSGSTYTPPSTCTSLTSPGTYPPGIMFYQ